jgi:hypothetical protein
MHVSTNVASPPFTVARDIVLQMMLNAGKYMPYAACSAWAQADFYNFVHERRNPSVLPSLGFEPRPYQ